jgi:hypothetical protein
MMKKITLLLILLSCSFGYSQDPTAGPTNPISRNAADLVSLYNGIAAPVAPQYTNETGVIFDSFGSAAVITDLTLTDGNTVRKYINHNFSGIGSGSYDVSSMTMLHIDVYFGNAAGDFRIKLEDQTGGTGATEISIENSPTIGEWISYDIPLTSFTAPNLAILKWIVPVTTATNTTLYFDNVYFSRPPTDPLKNATLSDLQVDGTTISGFGSSTITYSYNVPSGTIAVPQITLATPTEVGTGATASITNATTIPGDATVLVTSSDTTTTKTYTISIAETGPSTSAPTPPIRDATDVISIFSDAYTNVTIDDFDFGLCGTNPSVSEVMIAGFPAQNYLGQGCQGISVETNRIDASEFTNLHFDFYTDVSGPDLIGKVFNIKLVDWAGNETEAGSTGLEVNFNDGTSPGITTGSWVSVDVDITSIGGMVGGNLTRSDIAQIHITSNLPNAWYDNLYLYKEFFEPGTCSDGIKNQDELGVDCGGTISGCAPCSGPPTAAAPTPPARAAADVISIYSDAYTDIAIDAFDFGLCDGSVPNLATAEVMIAGFPAQNYLKPGCQGISIETNRIDASAFTNLHFDFFTDVSGDDLIGKVFNIKLVDWAGNETEAGSTGLEINFNDGTSPGIITSSWVSVDVDLTSFGAMVGGNLTRSDIAQIHITSNLPNAWYDNLYLHKNTTLGIENNELVDFNTYPNPTQENWTVKTKSESMSSIKVYDILGKQVLSLSPNSIEATINGASLKSGLYFAQIKTDSGLSNIKLIKN